MGVSTEIHDLLDDGTSKTRKIGKIRKVLSSCADWALDRGEPYPSKARRQQMTEPTHATAIDVTSDSFGREVIESDLPVLVDYWAKWCGPCKVLGPTVEAVARRLEGLAKVAKVDVDRNPSLADLYGIRSIPTLLLFKDGELVDGRVGVQSEQQLLDWISTHSGPGETNRAES